MTRFLEDTDVGFSLRRLAASCLQTTTLLGCAAIVIAHLTLSAYFDNQRERALDDARMVTRNLNTAFEQHVVRSIQNIDQLLLVGRVEYERDPSAFSPEALSNRDFFPKDLTLQLALIGRDGMMIGSSLPSSGVVDLSDREHFRFHVNNPRDELFISKPVLGRVSGAWVVQFTRKLRDANGDFAGVLVASLDPYYLSRIYESIDIGSTGAVTLLGLDGVIRARSGVKADVIGRTIPVPAVMSLLTESNAGTFEAASGLDGVQRITSFRRVRGQPLVVAVSVGRDEALAQFEESKVSLLQMTVLADLALLVLMGLGISESYRLRSVRERLSAKTRVLSSTLASLQEGILLVDKAGMVVAMNDLALELLGLDRFALPAPYTGLPLARREAGLAAASVQQISLADNRTVEVRTSALPDGGFVKTLNDISATKINQLAIEDARDKAEAATRARTSFLATMSHEIRTPLGGVLSMVDLIAGTKLDAVQKRYIEITRDSATHLLQLIDDVLDVTKLDADYVAFEDISFDLYRQVRSTLDIVSPRALDKGLSIGCVIAPETPRHIMGDPGRLRQVLINLLGNAVKFTNSGYVLLKVSCKPGPDGDRLLIRVQDTGIGIAPDNIKNLFVEFSQLDSSISRRFGGTGLGLAICRKLVSRMGGEIGVESHPDTGSVFFFDIPLRAVSAVEPLTQEPAVLAIVVRSAFERRNLQRQFRRSFQQVEAFETHVDAQQWLDVVACGRRRIVLIDVALAAHEGVRSWMLDAHRPEFVLMCARQDATALDEAVGRGYRGVVSKPVFPDDLRCALMSQSVDVVPETVAPSASSGRLAGLRVLIAEDNPTNQFALCRMLEAMGAVVTAASNGREAVDHAMAQKFDVVFMDVMMPELDGLAATRAIRGQAGPNSATSIIALTASAFIEDREAALAAGMDAFATKPITAQGLLETVDQRQRGVSQTPAPVSMKTIEGPALDRGLLDQLRADLGPEHMDVALGIFFKDLRKRVASLRSGDRSPAFLRQEAHALKGSAASFGFRRVADLASKLEEAALRNEAETFDDLLEALLDEADQAPELLVA